LELFLLLLLFGRQKRNTINKILIENGGIPNRLWLLGSERVQQRQNKILGKHKNLHLLLLLLTVISNSNCKIAAFCCWPTHELLLLGASYCRAACNKNTTIVLSFLFGEQIEPKKAKPQKRRRRTNVERQKQEKSDNNIFLTFILRQGMQTIKVNTN